MKFQKTIISYTKYYKIHKKCMDMLKTLFNTLNIDKNHDKFGKTHYQNPIHAI